MILGVEENQTALKEKMARLRSEKIDLEETESVESLDQNGQAQRQLTLFRRQVKYI